MPLEGLIVEDEDEGEGEGEGESEGGIKVKTLIPRTNWLRNDLINSIVKRIAYIRF